MSGIRSALSGNRGYPLLLAAATLVFLIAQIPFLNVPLFWDELGVYGPGILYMVDHGPGMLPSALPQDLSRGHPLLYYFLISCIMKLSSWSVAAFRLANIAISLLLVWATYRCSSRLLDARAGLIAGLGVLAMPHFFPVAGLGFPEMLLSLTVLLALEAFSRHKYPAYIAWCAAALFTKESALLVPLCCAAWALIYARPRVRGILVALSPLLLFGLFLIIQRVQNGWFFFPLHTDYIALSGPKLLRRISKTIVFVCNTQGRSFWLIAMAIAGAALLWVRRRQFVLHPFVPLSALFCVGLMAFTSINFFMERYLIAIFPFMAVCLAMLVHAWANVSPRIRPFAYALGFCLALLPITQIWQRSAYELDGTYRDYVALQQEAVKYLEQELLPDECFYANFPLYNSFQDPRLGYLSAGHELQASVVYDPAMRIAAEISPPANPSGNPDLPPERLIWERQNTVVRVRIYRWD
ncbi:MAG: hypothetical protein EAZ89_05425 [Bacteroidetes bacterium]|nr:MAG: hypothetical protein EAZ89_05425 [Bacteroidota bacterium]